MFASSLLLILLASSPEADHVELDSVAPLITAPRQGWGQCPTAHREVATTKDSGDGMLVWRKQFETDLQDFDEDPGKIKTGGCLNRRRFVARDIFYLWACDSTLQGRSVRIQV